jgi:hypothetical protein
MKKEVLSKVLLRVFGRFCSDKRGSALVFFEMIATIIGVSIIYAFAIYPCWWYLKEWMVWFGQSINCQEIVNLATFSAYVMIWIPYIFIVLTIIWAFRKVMESEVIGKILRW